MTNRRRQREELFDPDTIRRLEQIGVGRGWRCLEVGAGEGSIASWLADRAGEGLVTATDVAADYLEAARARLGARATVTELDLERSAPERGAYALVHLRFVLEHVAAKQRALTNLAAALEPGGWLIIEYTDFPSCERSGGAYADAMGAFAESLPMVGRHDTWAARLPEVMAGLGLTIVEATGRQRFFRGGSEEATYWSSLWFDRRRPMAAVGRARPGGHRIGAAVTEVSDPDRWFAGPMIVSVTGRRPT